MKYLLVVAVVFVAGNLLGQTNAINPTTTFEPKRAEECLKEIESKLPEVVVPEEVKKLGESIRSLNANLQITSLTKLIGDERAELDMYKAGIFNAEQIDKCVQMCAEFVGKFLGIVGATECGDKFVEIISPRYKSQYEDLMNGHSAVDEMVGYVEGCFIF